MACGVPLFSGIVAGVIGGILVTIFSGSKYSVSGPIAGVNCYCFSIHNSDWKLSGIFSRRCICRCNAINFRNFKKQAVLVILFQMQLLKACWPV